MQESKEDTRSVLNSGFRYDSFRHLNLSVRERGLKVDALKERVQREADNRAAACSSLR